MDKIQRHEADPVRQIFAPLIGLPAWSVRKGYGSFLTLEFGEPYLNIREPIIASPEASDQVRARLSRRQVTPVGEWHLWIYCCNWRVSSNGEVLANSESSDELIDVATRQIDGQLLTFVSYGTSKGTSKFTFDQGAILETWPYDDGNDEQWMLYMRSGEVFSYPADGNYQAGPGNQPVDDMGWKPLP